MEWASASQPSPSHILGNARGKRAMADLAAAAAAPQRADVELSSPSPDAAATEDPDGALASDEPFEQRPPLLPFPFTMGSHAP